MYPPESLFQIPSGETPPTSPLNSSKSSPILPKVDYAEAFTRVYHDSPQSSSPPSSLCPSSPPASVTSLGHADVGPPTTKKRGGIRSKQNLQSSYHPYVRKTPPTPQAERKMANVMGRLRLTGGMDSDLDDDMTCKIFSQGLQRLSSEGMRHAAYYKEAELEYHRHLSMALAWEAEKLSRLRDFIDCEQQEQEGQSIRAFEEAELFTRMVADRDAGRASQDLEFITSIQQEEAARVKQLNSELDELDIFLSPDTQATSDLEQQRRCESE
ncbi:hypothetical protein DEU56DRAFT_908191 [Suillus clintonianus]|uniref:uncharacterized protein n=1 Tax=Suillus clintonianus TaxID=1904413 RepID=UPI001B87770B|nr:uncharacterized protein DEU56DRAFT_908191 [Suillus clintonianus]KAG2151334.1 hypothetical protein DEU56DRAFT_908191 [Suillus clintonianus]